MYDDVRKFFAEHPGATWTDYYAHVKANRLGGFYTPEAEASMREDAARVISAVTVTP